jgi:hypothetical protein
MTCKSVAEVSRGPWSPLHCPALVGSVPQYITMLAGELAKVQEAADSERGHSFLSRLFRTDCYTEALHQLNVERCTELGSEQRTRLVRTRPSLYSPVLSGRAVLAECTSELLKTSR